MSKRALLKYKAFSLLLFATFSIMNGHNAVRLTQTNNAEIVFLISDHPKVGLDGTKALIVSDKDKYSYEFSEISKFEFIDYEQDAIYGVYGGSFMLKWNNNTLEGHNLKPDSHVMITDLSGRIYSNVMTDAMGSFTIDFIDLPKGVYMFISQGHTFKFYKK